MTEYVWFIDYLIGLISGMFIACVWKDNLPNILGNGQKKESR